jgi:hypothetical protein
MRHTEVHEILSSWTYFVVGMVRFQGGSLEHGFSLTLEGQLELPRRRRRGL